ncbi:MAG: hypothetical protein IPM24_25885 [Bryobacterales bacterium]|jgi:hypothetical protein|nr:hypothetical protein [Bryobacterales bacterium]
MDSFRDFEAGPDPFGRKYRVVFKWMQTAIAIRGADTVDVKFIVTADDGETVERVIALPHALLLKHSDSTGQPVTDPWCNRLAAEHLRTMIETGEDLDKSLVTLDEHQIATADAALPKPAVR